jgi:hypothetical protein
LIITWMRNRVIAQLQSSDFQSYHRRPQGRALGDRQYPSRRSSDVY